MRLVTTLRAPPGGWRYQQPETGWWGKAITFETLLRSVAQHRQNNRLTPVNAPHISLAAEIEDWICQQLSPADRVPNCGAKPPPRDWPLLLLPLKALAVPSDRGMGDIVERLIGPVGGDAYKVWFEKSFGKPCGCSHRQDNLNEKFPL